MALFSFRSYSKGSSTNAVVYAAAVQGNVAKLKQLFAANPKLASLKDNLLLAAAENGQKQAMEYLISQGADVNKEGFQKMTSLAQLSAIWMRSPDSERGKRIAEGAAVLIAHGAAVDPVDDYGDTPLLHAVEVQNSELARVLLEHGADLHRRYAGLNSGKTVLHMAVGDQDKAMVALLLKFKAPVDAVDREGATPLLWAEERNETEIAAMLRAANPNATHVGPRYSVPPTKEYMRTLARRIADGDAAAFDELESTAKKLYGEIKDYQVEHARVMVLLERMKAAFDVLGGEAGRGNDNALEALKKCLGRRSPVRSFAPDALGIAAAGGNKEALDILLHYRKWDILESTADFALCKPAKANVGPAVDYWVNWLGAMTPWKWGGGIMLDATNALASAAAQGNQKAREALDKLAPPPGLNTIRSPTSLPRPRPSGSAPYHWAYLIGDTNRINRLLESKDFDAVDANGDTPLMWAVKARRTDFARLFLEHGAKIVAPASLPNPQFHSGMNDFLGNQARDKAPLFWAVMHDETEMVKLLLEFKAPLDATDAQGKTPLHYAVAANNKKMVKLLLDADAPLNTVDHAGATPLFLAEAEEHKEVSGMLRQAASSRGVSVTGVDVPTREAMRALAERICAGDPAAFDALEKAASGMSQGNWRTEARRRLNADRMNAAFHLLGEEAAKRNDYAFQALKRCLGDKLLRYAALDPLGLAAAAGHQEALQLLLHCHERWGVLENSVCFALAASAKANRKQAVDYFVTLALDPQSAKHQFFGVSWLIKDVLETAADNGYQKAKVALKKFTVASAQ